MGYSSALTAAGANVIAYQKFGDYQGSWGAICDINNERVLVVGSYGSCSSCDAFEAEFGHDDCHSFNDETGEYELDPQLQADYEKRLCEFGKSYLNNPYTKDIVKQRYESLKKEAEDDWFSMESLDLYSWAMPYFQ